MILLDKTLKKRFFTNTSPGLKVHPVWLYPPNRPISTAVATFSFNLNSYGFSFALFSFIPNVQCVFYNPFI